MEYFFPKKKNLGFTLMEVLVVVVVLSVLAFIALPKFYSAIRNISNQEAKNILLTLYSEQIKYAKDNDAFCPSVAALDVDIPAPTKFQSIPVGTALHGTVACSGVTVAYLASMTSIDNNYVLYVLTDGTIACTPCPNTICRGMGFGDFTGATLPCGADGDCVSNNCVLPPGICVN